MAASCFLLRSTHPFTFPFINLRLQTYNEAWKSFHKVRFVVFSRNLKKWNKFLCTVVVKSGKIGYTRDTDFLGCSRALSF